jgi:hypothetical protein
LPITQLPISGSGCSVYENAFGGVTSGCVGRCWLGRFGGRAGDEVIAFQAFNELEK